MLTEQIRSRACDLPEPQTIQQALEYIGYKVCKFFPESEVAPAGWYKGIVTEVVDSLDSEYGEVYPGIYFGIRYEDDDAEHIDWNCLKEWLVMPDEGRRTKSRRLNSSEGVAANVHDSDAGLSEHHLEGPPLHELPEAAAKAARKRRERNRPSDEHNQYSGDENCPPAKQRKKDNAKSSSGSSLLSKPAKSNEGSPEDLTAAVAAAPQTTQGAQQEQTPVAAAVDVPSPTLEKAQALNARREGFTGHIYKVRVENFMCHECHELELRCHVNIISGTNGSGKSAILQAIQCCLGAAARQTGRSNNMAGFIREGAYEAKIQVTIWNTGEEAYKPEIFGIHIIVERRIRKSGSEFRLLDMNGKVREQGKGALSQLLEYINVDAANPLTVLTQDYSRDFLAGNASDKKKMALFMHGTSLQETEVNLRSSTANLDIMHSRVEVYNQQLEALWKEWSEVQQNVKSLKRLEGDRKMRDNIELGLGWQIVLDFRKEKEQIQQLVDVQLPGNVERARVELEQAEKALEQADQQLDAVKLRIQQLNDQVQAIMNGTQDTRSLEQKFAHEAIMFKRAEAQIFQQLQALQREKADLERILQNANDDRTQSQQAALKGWTDKLNNIQQELNAVKQFWQESRVKFEALDDTVNKLKDQRQEKQEELAAAVRELNQLRDEYGHASNNQNRHLSNFGGRNTYQVQQLIQQRIHEFHHRPIGPVGALLRLTADARWAKAIESALGNALLDAYIVHDGHDSRLLRQIIRQTGGNNMVYSVRFDLDQHKIPEHELPPQRFLTVLRGITCTDPDVQSVVMNILVDAVGAENVVVVQTSEEAREILYKGIAGRRVNRVFEPDGTVWQKSGGSVSCFPARDQRLPRLGVDSSGMMRQLQQQIEDHQLIVGTLEAELTRINQQMQQVQPEYNAVFQQQKDAGMQQFHLRRSATETQKVVEELTQSMQQEDPEARDNNVAIRLAQVTVDVSSSQIDLNSWQSKREEAEQRSAQLREQLRSSSDEMARLAEESSQQEAQLSTLALAKQSATEAVAVKKQKLEHCEKQLKVALLHLREFQENEAETIEMAEAHCSEAEGMAALKEVESVFRQRQYDILSKKPEAAAATPEQIQQLVEERVQKTMNMNDLQKELDRLKARIKTAEQNAGGNIQELEIRAAEMNVKLVHKKATSEKLTKVYNELSVHVKNCWNKYYERRAVIADCVNKKFRQYMKRKRHTGDIRFNWDDEKITLEVKINGKGDDNAKPVTDLKQLSGGERSFTTVCFILAMAEYTDTMFRCMDEYDVFMDAVTRRISTETLLEFAMESSHLQYIFLTPQDLQGVDEAKKNLEKRKGKLPEGFLKVMQMKPARPHASS